MSLGRLEIAGASTAAGAITAVITAIADVQPSGSIAAAAFAAGGLAYRLFKHMDRKAEEARAETAAAHASTIAAQAAQLSKLSERVEQLLQANLELQRQLAAQSTGVRMIKRPDGSTEFVRDHP